MNAAVIAILGAWFAAGWLTGFTCALLVLQYAARLMRSGVAVDGGQADS